MATNEQNLVKTELFASAFEANFSRRCQKYVSLKRKLTTQYNNKSSELFNLVLSEIYVLDFVLSKRLR